MWCTVLICQYRTKVTTILKLTEIEKGLPLVSLSGQLVCTHELLKLSLGYMFQDVLQSKRIRRKHWRQYLGFLTSIMPHVLSSQSWRVLNQNTMPRALRERRTLPRLSEFLLSCNGEESKKNIIGIQILDPDPDLDASQNVNSCYYAQDPSLITLSCKYVLTFLSNPAYKHTVQRANPIYPPWRR